MLLNNVEFALMNNPIRSLIQRRFEAKRLFQMGGRMDGGRALEIGCGRGVGCELILDLFGAEFVDAFDLDPRMVRRARGGLRHYGSRANVWVGDASTISVSDDSFDAVFDFGIIHHVPNWRKAVAEVVRVLKPGGRFYGEEVLRRFIVHPFWRRVLEHPQGDRFDTEEFQRELKSAGLVDISTRVLWGSFAWFTARKRSR